MKMKLSLALVGSLLAGFLTNAHAWQSCQSGQWASINYGSWTVYMDAWGSNTGSPQICANGWGNWAGSGDWSGGGIKAYPHAGTTVSLPLSQTRYWSTSSYNVSAPANTGAVWYDWTYDLWTTGSVDEVMIIMNQYPLDANSGWGTRIASNVTIGDNTFNVYQANPGWNVIQFISTTQKASASVDLWSTMKWCYNNGRLRNSTWTETDFGVEITATNGWQTWTCNSFWAGWGTW